MKVQDIYIRSKAKYNKKETLCSITLLEEETSILTVDSKEEDDEEEWVEAEDRSYIINAHNWDTLQGIVKTLVPLSATVGHLTML
jgi:hypothetical protein